MTPPAVRPARTSSLLALVTGAVAVGVSASGPFPPFLVTAMGFGTVALGLVRASRGWLAAGAVGMIAGITFAGIGDLSPVLVVLGATATVVTWDLAERAVGLGEQLGRDAGTFRNEAAHVGTTAAVGILAGASALLVPRIAVRSLPLPALVTALLGGFFLVVALRT